MFAKLMLAVIVGVVAAPMTMAAEKEVVVIGTLHGDHNRFPLYTFQTLEIVLKNLAPDLLLIEEDPKTYADKLYEKLSEDEYNKIRPVEIRKVILPYAKANNVKVIPTDWRVGFDEESKTFEDQHKKLLADPKNRARFETIMRSYESIFVDDYLTRSIYDLHSDTFMAILEQRDRLFDGTPFQKSRELDRKRQDTIDKNVVEALKNESFKRAVVIYGISHRPFIVRAIHKARAARVLRLEEA